jgi:hypothetical protein
MSRLDAIRQQLQFEFGVTRSEAIGYGLELLAMVDAAEATIERVQELYDSGIFADFEEETKLGQLVKLALDGDV